MKEIIYERKKIINERMSRWEKNVKEKSQYESKKNWQKPKWKIKTEEYERNSW